MPGMRGSPDLFRRRLRQKARFALHFRIEEECVLEGDLRMATRKQTRSSNRTRQTRTPIGDRTTANRTTTSVRKPSKPPLTEPFHVAVDRQLKSGHETYEAAEKAALEIKKRYPQLHVTVFDAKEQRHTLIEQPRLAGASNKNRLAEEVTRNAVERHKTVVGAGKR
jgi:hypothetical protein